MHATAVAALCAASAGCASTRHDAEVGTLSQERAAAVLVTGRTTKDDVRHAFGEAIVTAFPSGREVWLYHSTLLFTWHAATPAAGHAPAGRPAPRVHGGHAGRPAAAHRDEPALAAIHAATDICATRAFRNPFFAERPLSDVTLVAGSQRPARGAGQRMAVQQCGTPAAGTGV